MSPYQKKQKDKRRKNLFRKWHRRIGFTAAVLLINLAVTGILLNHSDDLELHKNYIETDWIVNSYGISPPKEAKCIAPEIKNLRLCQLGEKLYLNSKQLIEHSSELIGLVEFDDLFYLASSQELYVFTKGFELVEKLDENSGLPLNISAMTVLDNYQDHEKLKVLVIKTQDKIWKLDPTNMSWHSTEIFSKMPPRLISLDESELSQLQDAYLDHQITMLKFVQDLHSFRFLPFSAKFITDLSGIVIIVLVLSGFYAWQRRTNKVS